MKNVQRIGSSITILLAIGMLIVLISINLLKLDTTMAYIIGGVVGGIVGYLYYRIENPIFNVFRFTVLGWSIGLVLGLVYIAIFDPHEAQGIFLAIIWTGPIAGIAGFIYGIMVLMRQKKIGKGKVL